MRHSGHNLSFASRICRVTTAAPLCSGRVSCGWNRISVGVNALLPQVDVWMQWPPRDRNPGGHYAISATSGFRALQLNVPISAASKGQ